MADGQGLSAGAAARAPDALVFPSRVDAWLVAVLALAVGLCVWQGVATGSAVSLAIGAATLAVVLALTVPCRYTLEADHLAVRCGLIRQQVPYARIRGVEASRNPLSAPALSCGCSEPLRYVEMVTDDSTSASSRSLIGRATKKPEPRPGSSSVAFSPNTVPSGACTVR